MTSFSSSRADNDDDDDAAAASFDYSGMAPRSLAGNDTQKVGGQSTYISVADRSLPSTRPIGELLPRFRGTWMFSSAKQLNNSRKGDQTGKKHM